MTERIGNFLVKIGVMTKEQVDAVLRVQASGDDRLFGQIAVDLGMVEEAAVEKFEAEKRASADDEE